MIKVLVVDDSPVDRGLLVATLSADAGIDVVGTARDGLEALEFVARSRPDVITMDITMPKMDGVEATRRIMETHPVPIVVVSGSWNPDEVAQTFPAIEAGAVAGVSKLLGPGHEGYAQAAQELVQTVKLMSEVKVVRRWPHAKRQQPPPGVAAPIVAPSLAHSDVRVVAIGSSTGGPMVLQAILSRLPREFVAPLLIVQHIAGGFLGGLVEWLEKTSGFPIRIAQHGELLTAGQAYVGPDAVHMGVDRGGRILLSRDPVEHSLRPAVSYLFRSVANVYGKSAVGVLLTGMGCDGAEELRLLKDRGAITIAQDKASSAVHGMPGEAIKLGGATHVLPPEKIAEALCSLTDRSHPFRASR